MGFCAAVLVLCAGALCHVSSVESGMLRILLTRHKPTRQALLESGYIIESNNENLLQATSVKPPHPHRNNDSIALHKYLDNEFYGDVGIGHPAQQFRIIFDSAWSNSWVPSAKCPLLNVACQIHNKYHSEASSTYVENGKNFSIPLGNNHSLNGFLSTDNVHFAHLSIHNMTFAEITSVPRDMLTTKADGVFGMALPSLAVDNLQPFFYTLVEKHLIDKPIFSIFLNRDPTTQHGGSLFLGGSDPKHYFGNFTYLPVLPGGYWKVRMDRMELNIKSKNKTVPFCVKGCDVILDTSTSGINGPHAEIIALNLLINAKKSPYLNRFVVDCNMVPKLPSVSFLFGKGEKFTLKSAQYVVKMSIKGFGTFCVSAFMPSDSQEWVLGAAFMSKYYTEFDIEQMHVGFALGKMW